MSLGVLAMFSKRKIDADEDALLQDFANTAAQVIRTGRGEESLQKAHDELEDNVQQRTAELAKANEELVVLNAIAETVSRSLDLQGILDSALERIVDLLKARTG